jgi:hypothetical protein
MRVVSIVEGDGEVTALPVLLRRIAAELRPESEVEVTPPIRVRKDRFLNRNEEFNRYLRLAWLKAGLSGQVILLLDADDDCPVSAAASILKRANEIDRERDLAVVLANREYESWFLASAKSLVGRRGFRLEAEFDQVKFDAERIRDAKGWLKQRMVGNAYRETSDQAALSAVFDMQLARSNSRSFRKLWSELSRYLEAAR